MHLEPGTEPLLLSISRPSGPPYTLEGSHLISDQRCKWAVAPLWGCHRKWVPPWEGGWRRDPTGSKHGLCPGRTAGRAVPGLPTWCGALTSTTPPCKSVPSWALCSQPATSSAHEGPSKSFPLSGVRVLFIGASKGTVLYPTTDGGWPQGPQR